MKASLQATFMHAAMARLCLAVLCFLLGALPQHRALAQPAKTSFALTFEQRLREHISVVNRGSANETAIFFDRISRVFVFSDGDTERTVLHLFIRIFHDPIYILLPRQMKKQSSNAPQHRVILIYKSGIFFDRSIDEARLRALRLPPPIEQNLLANYAQRRYKERCDYAFFSRPDGYVTNSVIAIDPKELLSTRIKCFLGSMMSLSGFHVGNDPMFPSLSDFIEFIIYRYQRDRCLNIKDGKRFLQCVVQN